MSLELRNSLWNTLHLDVWSSEPFTFQIYYTEEKIYPFSKHLWFLYFKKPIDSIPSRPSQILSEIRQYFFEAKWNEVYDFLEFVIKCLKDDYPYLEEHLNLILSQELSGYRIVSGLVTDITSQEEIEMLECAIEDSRFIGVSKHLRCSLEHLSNRKNPDYRNSIKESILAVESMARIVTENAKATLGDALKVLEKSGKLHSALKNGFLKIYGYTSDEDGIRHAMMNEPNLTYADAKYFLMSCTSFINYLKEKLAK